MFQYVGTEFICAVRPVLKDRWTDELEQAWKVMKDKLECVQKVKFYFPGRTGHVVYICVFPPVFRRCSSTWRGSWRTLIWRKSGADTNTRRPPAESGRTRQTQPFNPHTPDVHIPDWFLLQYTSFTSLLKMFPVQDRDSQVMIKPVNKRRLLFANLQGCFLLRPNKKTQTFSSFQT